MRIVRQRQDHHDESIPESAQCGQDTGQLPQECAFITDEMTQGAFEEKLAQIGDQVLAKIRVKD